MRMIANSLVTTSLVLVTAFAAAQARAAELDATSTVDAVTVYPDGASVTRVIAVDLAAGDTTLVARDFPLGLDASSLRVEGEAATRIVIGAIDAKPPRAAPPVNLPEIDRRIEALKDERVNLARRDGSLQCAAQIRGALCRGLARRPGREGRGASDRGMAHGLCRGRRGGGGGGRRHSRGRAQAARHRPPDRAARSRSRGQAAEQARSPHRSRRHRASPRDAEGDLRGATCALDCRSTMPVSTPARRTASPRSNWSAAPRSPRSPARTGRTSRSASPRSGSAAAAARRS